MRTVICDDDEKLCRILQIFLEEYGESRGISVDVEVFSDGEILLQQLETGKQYDLLFLDIIMKHVDGIRVGEFVRNRMEDFHTRILYMSGSKEHLLELFDSQPVGFLEKPLTREKVNSGMDRILRQMEENSFCYRSGRISRQVPYREILYYESCGRKVLVHTNDGIYEYFGKLSQIMDQGLPSNFLCIHKSYIVNLDHVGEIHRDCMYLPEKNRWLSISKIHRRQVEIAAEEHRTVFKKISVQRE